MTKPKRPTNGAASVDLAAELAATKAALDEAQIAPFGRRKDGQPRRSQPKPSKRVRGPLTIEDEVRRALNRAVYRVIASHELARVEIPGHGFYVILLQIRHGSAAKLAAGEYDKEAPAILAGFVKVDPETGKEAKPSLRKVQNPRPASRR